MALNDHRTLEDFRILLIQEWVDLSRLRYSVSKGVIFISGELRPCYAHNGTSLAEESIALARRLEGAARILPGVHNVVFTLSNLHKNGKGWEFKYAEKPKGGR